MLIQLQLKADSLGHMITLTKTFCMQSERSSIFTRKQMDRHILFMLGKVLAITLWTKHST